MKLIKPNYCSPTLEIVPFDDEDILTVSTHGENPGDAGGDTGGGNSEIDFGDLNFT